MLCRPAVGFEPRHVRIARKIACLAAAVIVAASCSGQSTTSCYPGDRQSCACSGGGTGFQTCEASGQLGACACGSGAGGGASAASSSASGSGTGGSDGGAGGKDAGGDAADGGLLPFMSPCTANAQCETGLCWNFPTKGSHCSKMCATDADCPPPSPGCNPQGVCRAP
jgi:hypothetical protein